jgi:hypothetical protein
MATGRQIYLSSEEIEFVHSLIVERQMADSDDADYYEEHEPEVPKLLERIKKKMWYYG